MCMFGELSKTLICYSLLYHLSFTLFMDSFSERKHKANYVLFIR